MQPPLFRDRDRERFSREQHVVRRPAEQGVQARVGRQRSPVLQKHRSGDEDVARPQRRVEAAGQAEADQAARARADEPGYGELRAGRRPAADLDPGADPVGEAAGDPRLGPQPDDDADQAAPP